MNSTLTLAVTVDDVLQREVFATKLQIASTYVQAFEPIDVVDDPMMLMTSSRARTCYEARRVTKRRQDLATDLAGRLTTMLLEAMEARDTRNGYPKDRISNDL